MKTFSIIIPTFNAAVHPIQQGCVPGRIFVGNVVQLDLESRVDALRWMNNRRVSQPSDSLPAHSIVLQQLSRRCFNPGC